MAKDKEKLQVEIMLLACVAAMIIPIFAWWSQFKINAGNLWFLLVDLALSVAMFFMARQCRRQGEENETETNGTRAITIAIAVVDFLWIAGWAAYQNELIK